MHGIAAHADDDGHGCVGRGGELWGCKEWHVFGIENGPFIVDFPMKNGDLPMKNDFPMKNDDFP
jgi:hypothetical protein